MKKLIMIFLALLVVSGCSQHIPKPKDIKSIYKSFFEIKAEAATLPDQDFTVKTFVKENNVYIECYMKNYRFSQVNEKEWVTIMVSIDGKKHSEQSTAAFIVKQVPNGKHTIRLDIINKDGEQIGLTKEFEVHIHSTI